MLSPRWVVVNGSCPRDGAARLEAAAAWTASPRPRLHRLVAGNNTAGTLSGRPTTPEGGRARTTVAGPDRRNLQEHRRRLPSPANVPTIWRFRAANASPPPRAASNGPTTPCPPLVDNRVEKVCTGGTYPVEARRSPARCRVDTARSPDVPDLTGLRHRRLPNPGRGPAG